MNAHPLADLFPLMGGQELAHLIKSIHENGQRDPIIVYEGMILDGRNRYQACTAAGVEPAFAPFPGGDPLDFIVDHNLHRRHLDASQRAMIAAEIANMKFGGDRRSDNFKMPIGPLKISSDNQPVTSVSVENAAKKMGVGETIVKQARTVNRSGNPELIEKVKSGEVSVYNAHQKITGEQRKSRAVQKKSQPTSKLPMSERGGNMQRVQNMRVNAEIWSHLKAALVGLTNLPAVDDVVSIVTKQPKMAQLTGARLVKATKWLREFSDAWNLKTGGGSAA